MGEENPAYYEIQRKTKKLTITIVRDNGSHGHFQSSKPCIHCQELLVKLKFKKIIYTNEKGDIEVKRPHQMDSTHFSRAQRLTGMEMKKNRCNFIGKDKKYKICPKCPPKKRE